MQKKQGWISIVSAATIASKSLLPTTGGVVAKVYCRPFHERSGMHCQIVLGRQIEIISSVQKRWLSANLKMVTGPEQYNWECMKVLMSHLSMAHHSRLDVCRLQVLST